MKEQTTTAYAQSDSIRLGQYPTSRVGRHHARVLTKRALPLPTADNAYDWTDMGFYINGKREPFAWYIDIECGRKWYRGVYFDKYRPNSTQNYSAAREKSDVFANGWYIKTVYWFRYEPIEWRVVEENQSTMTLVAMKVLDSQAFNDLDQNGNLYGLSTVRAWLNDHFLHTAFDENERRKLVQRKLRVAGVLPKDYPDDWEEACGYIEIADEVTLPSEQDMRCPKYAEGNNQYALGDNWVLGPTDYAKCLGAWHREMRCHCDGDERESGTWWLRDIGEYRHAAKAVHNLLIDEIDTQYTGIGVMPSVTVWK